MNTTTEIIVWTIIAVIVGMAVYTVSHVILKII